jgi:hypothetical protein
MNPAKQATTCVGDERFRDVNAWLMAEQRKGRPGN